MFTKFLFACLLAGVAAQDEFVEALAEFVEPSDKCFLTEDSDGGLKTQLCINGTTGGVYLKEQEDDFETQASKYATDMDTMWVIICGAMVFFMQAGFGILEAGCISEKNVINIMFKNVMDASIAGICYWLLGYGLAYGDENDGPFIGGSNFALTGESGDSFHSFFFQWAFAATAATIVAGSVAERCLLEAYFVYSIILTVFIYPVVAHWIWDSEGWLSAFNDVPFLGESKEGPGGVHNMIDFAGCAVVHMVGGWAGFVAAFVIGPRKGRFENGPPEAHNLLYCGMGVLFLWFGWYGFNCGSTLAMSGGNSMIASRVATTTTISAASGCITACIIGKVFYGKYDFLLCVNGILAGLVSITSACFCVEPWAALIIGMLGTVIYKLASNLLIKLKIDDPLDAAPVHGFCGMWGALCPGIFSSDALLKEVMGNDNDAFSTGKQFATQLIGVLAVWVWTVGCSLALFYGIKYTIGIRVSEDDEIIGLDVSEHGGKAYSYMAAGAKKQAPEAAAVELQA